MTIIRLLDIAACLLAVYIIRNVWFRTKIASPLPPGPKPRPLIGNALDLPKGYDWLHWAEHKDIYGPISSVTAMGQTIVILSDVQLAFKMLDKRSAIYSNRPTLTFGGELCGWENTIALQHYGPRLREYRKRVAKTLGTRGAASNFYFVQEVETRRFLLKVFRGGTDGLLPAIRSTAGAIILRISHGYNIQHDGHDPLVDLADEVVMQFSSAMIPGAWLVDLLPILRYIPSWLPGAGFQRTAQLWKACLNKLVDTSFMFVKQRMAEGNADHSYTSTLLQELEDSIENNGVDIASPNARTEEEFVIKWTAGSLYLAGADTTVAVITNFFACMLQYVDVMRKAQAEIDDAIGPDRLPLMSDRSNLPYVAALVKEVIRWHPILPMGFPHVNTEDDLVNGYFIPKGSLIIQNIWLFTHDAANYHDPMKFEPERFLPGGTGQGGKPEMDPRDLVFGFGRRICPGKDLADASIFISIAMALAVFDIGKTIDPDTGNEVNPPLEYTSGMLSYPKPFHCKVTPRSKRAEELLLSIERDYPYDPSDSPHLRHA